MVVSYHIKLETEVSGVFCVVCACFNALSVRVCKCLLTAYCTSCVCKPTEDAGLMSVLVTE